MVQPAGHPCVCLRASQQPPDNGGDGQGCPQPHGGQLCCLPLGNAADLLATHALTGLLLTACTVMMLNLPSIWPQKTTDLLLKWTHWQLSYGRMVLAKFGAI